jgi:arsenate reductase (thioredoxin)
MRDKPEILFLSTGDATRSHMAQGFFRKLGGESFHVLSAGVDAGAIHPAAMEMMAEFGVDIAGQKSTSVAEVLKHSCVCGVMIYDAAKERSPIFPFTLRLLRWSVVDPCRAAGDAGDQRKAFRTACDQLREETEKLLREIAQKYPLRTPIAA